MPPSETETVITAPTSLPSDPAKPGRETSEFSLTRLAVIVSAALSGLTVTLTQLKDSFPDSRWIGATLALLGTVAGLVAVVMKYSGGRAAGKVAQIEGAAHVQAAAAINPSKGAP